MDYPRRQATPGNLSPLIARLIPIIIGLGGVLMFMMQNCQQGPFGRRQLLGLKPEEEKVLGLQAFQEVRQKEARNILPESDPCVKQIKQITLRLIAAAKQPEVYNYFKLKEDNFEWALDVIESDQANAFCLPGGKMVVYTGILKVAQNDAALAAVIGHEIAHALARHGSERMGLEQVKQQGIASIGAGLGDMSPTQRAVVMQVIGAAATFGGTLPFSRDHESEADRMGLILMAEAGYDPKQSIGLWQRMAENSGGKAPPEFASTHPSNDTRIQQLTEWQEEASLFYRNSERQPTRDLIMPGSVPAPSGRGFPAF